jgi:hypothetical protein
VSPFPHDEPYRSMRRQVRQCRSCRAPIVWSTTMNDKKMPMDAVPVEDGGWRFVDGKVRKIVSGGEEMGPDELRYTAHWETCPDARQWRKPHEVAS